MKYDDDKDALAAEYVLGTLSSDERDQAEAMLSIDPGFEAAVRQWERRLGELNVMVEAVEPRPQVWDRIKVGLGHQDAGHEDAGREHAELALPRIENVAPHVPDDLQEPEGLEQPEEDHAPEPALTLDASDQPEPEPETAETAETEETETAPVESAHLAALEASLFQPETGSGAGAAPSVRAEPRATSARSADIIILAHRAAHWRRMTAIAAAIAALLAVYVAVSRVAPDLLPAPLRGTQIAAHAPAAPGRSQQDRLVAVLQQEPTAPAFLLTLDTRTRALTVRRVAATPETGRSYQLWLIAKQFPNPQSLGVVGENEFTQRALPANYDVDTLRSASYAISLEPAGGSPSSGPTGPVLFTGKAVESLPSAPPPAPKT
jgi:anti-sigma-K factor RskA